MSVEAWKAEGNAALTAGENQVAVECYSKGIEAAAGEGMATGKVLSQLHSNRAQSLLRLGDAPSALEDCEAAIRCDPANGKAYWRGATAAAKVSRYDVVADVCRRGLAAVGESPGLQDLLEEAELALSGGAVGVSSGASPAGGVAETASSGSRSGGFAWQRPVGVKEPVSAAAAAKLEAQKRAEAARYGAKGRFMERVAVPSMAQELADRGLALMDRFCRATPDARDDEDIRKARRLFEQALQEDINNETALLGLGDLLDQGLGCESDPIRASQCYMHAQSRGSERAKVKLCLQGLAKWAVAARTQALEGPPEAPPPAPTLGALGSPPP